MPLKTDPPSPEFLLRSRIEITRVLDRLLADRDPIASYIGRDAESDEGEEVLLVTRLLEVDPEKDWLVFAYSPGREANARLLALAHVRFVAQLQTGRIEFAVHNPRETEYGDQLAFKTDFPAALVRLERRRAGRVRVPARTQVHCRFELASGKIVEGLVSDLGLTGFGALILAPSVRVRRGTMLRRVRITIPNQGRICLDVEVSHSTRIMGRGGPTQRVGGRFIGDPRELEALLREFVIDLDEG